MPIPAPGKIPPPPPLSLDAASPFRYVGGDPSIDLVNTADWTRRGIERDRLVSYRRVVRWAEGAGVLSPAAGARLLRQAYGRPGAALAAQRDMMSLRWTLRRMLLECAKSSGHWPPRELAIFNARLIEALGHLRLAHGESGRGAALRWTWAGAGDDLRAPLWPVVRAAAQLLTSDDAGRVRLCAGADCGWMFVDRSRNGLRRWCQMATCGTREKTRRRRAKSR